MGLIPTHAAFEHRSVNKDSLLACSLELKLLPMIAVESAAAKRYRCVQPHHNVQSLSRVTRIPSEAVAERTGSRVPGSEPVPSRNRGVSRDANIGGADDERRRGTIYSSFFPLTGRF
jgi:hypothetical protein